MSSIIIIGFIMFLIIALTAYVTAFICNLGFKSEWQVIRYAGNSIEPKEIYICKRCYNKADTNYHYCNNCGAKMTNGVPRDYHYSDKIDLSEQEK